jgi:hypothetical protein|tara:strand:+ start:720 stop:917 length:198 start_codon:yes stop_codon:yes gene_type:complete
MEEAFVLINGKGGRLFIVEGTKALILGAMAPEFYMPPSHLIQGQPAPEVVKKTRWKTHIRLIGGW